MKALFALSLLGVCAFPLLAAEKPKPTSLTSFGEVVEVNVVNVDVYATDKSGKRVTDLRQGDFELFEDGKPVPITNFVPVRGGARAAAGDRAPVSAPQGAAPAPEDARNLIVFVDNFNIQPAHRTRALEQLRELFAQGLTSGDRVMLVSDDQGLRVRQPFTSDPAALGAALREMEKAAAHGPQIENDRRHAFETIMSIQEISLVDPDPLPCPVSIATPAHDYAAARRAEVLRSLGVLTVLVNSLSGVPGRKAVLHVSDGIPATPGEELFQFLVELCGGSGTSGFGRQQPIGAQGTATGGSGGDSERSRPKVDTNLDPYAVYDARSIGPRAYQAASQGPIDAQNYSVTKNLSALVAHANAHRVTLYTLQASGVEGTTASESGFGPGDRLFQFPSIGTFLRMDLQDSLHTLAAGTGGKAILNANDFRHDFAVLREDFSTFYSLGYSPAHNGDGREHRIAVKVKRAGVRLRYRESYRDKPVLEKAVDRTLAALFYGIEDNPLAISVEVGEQLPGPAGTIAVPIRLKIPLHKLAILNHEQTYEGSLRLLVATRSEDGRTAPVRQVAVPIKIPRKEVLNALGQFYLYTLTLQLPPGTHRVAVGVRDEIAATTTYLSRAVTVGAAAAAHP